ncbi:MAG: ATP-binding cassette domain-containing protein, partial [Halobacteria archaeon]|nr:ATP-binding cassette domain-containing protein [Halobacteria archaeon]
MNNLLSISGLKTHFDTERGSVKAVDDIDLDIPEGKTVGLVGESGSGKSVTALSIMDLIDDPGEIVSGEVHLGAVESVRMIAREHPKGIETATTSGFVVINDGHLGNNAPGDVRSEHDGSIESLRRLARDNPQGITTEKNEGYIEIESGYVDLVGAPERVMRDIRGGEMSMIFQDPMTSLNPVLTVGEQIAESLNLHQYEGKRNDTWFNALREIFPKIGSDIDEEIYEDTLEMLEEVGIPEPTVRIDDHPHEFSGGMRQ